MNHLMTMDDNKVFPQDEYKLETLIETIRICNQDIGMELGIKNVPYSWWNVEKEKQRKR